jgi:hypothetical protein
MRTTCTYATTFFKVVATILIASQAVINFSCTNNKNTKLERVTANPLHDKIVGMDTVKNRWASWNILLKENTGSGAVSTALLDFENAIIDEMNSTSTYSGLSVHFQVFYCPCDTLLYNIGATLINGAGYTVTSPPPPPPPAGSGDILFVSNNNHMPDIDDSVYVQGPPPDSSKKLQLPDSLGKIGFSTKALAVIDTGIDTSFFSGEIRKLMTNQPVFNVVGGNVHSFFDDHSGKHGTVVTALALQAVKDENKKLQISSNPLPSLMILKALDNQKQGSTFTVSCALSYAIQHKAAVINASLGYYDYNQSTDSVFRHYIELTKSKAIPIFAAAGNLPAVKTPGMVCNEAGTADSLQNRRRFFPACFSPDFDNVYTITGLTNLHASCFYQNYSPTYVTMGVLQTRVDVCCHFTTPFASGEGTSFATPVACGTALSFMINGHTLNDFILSLSKDPSLSGITKTGQYMNYFSR